MRGILYLVALIVAALALVSVTAVEAKRTRQVVRTWAQAEQACNKKEPLNFKYYLFKTKNACDLPKLVKHKCSRKDGRGAFDAIWDARVQLGFDCGGRQTKFRGNTHQNICGKVAKATTIPEIYAASGCSTSGSPLPPKNGKVQKPKPVIGMPVQKPQFRSEKFKHKMAFDD
ncbi:hypothetical protein HDU97_001510 [Phlyctochytrium planicorne]|nr:hypothetical protein HDU97_001510 [Phlyctochytrium planicorne]